MSFLNLKLVLIGTLAFTNPAHAYFEASPENDPNPMMNGIYFNQYKDFPKNWHQVTVRYRTDSKEMRFTYANDIAWAAMKSLKPQYPDGAIFAKVGRLSETDPAFPSSIVPSGAKRYQFMVKDAKKYKETDGWGYALFTDKGQLFKEDVRAKTLACAACHRIVPERDFVFSRSAQLEFGSDVFPTGISESKVVQFVRKSSSEVPKSLKSFLSTSYESLEGELKRNAFSGTLDEVVPLLIEKSKKLKVPAALIIDPKNMSLVAPTTQATACLDGKGMQITVVFNGKTVRNAQVCNE